MTEATPHGPEKASKTTWADVVSATTAKDDARIERETVVDVLDVELTEADLAEIARENAADDAEQSELQRQLEGFKAEMKDRKTAIDAIDQRIRDRNNSVRKGSQSIKGEWILERIFDRNEVRYLHPTSDRVMKVRPMEPAERQTVLALGKALETVPKKQLSLDDAKPADAKDAGSPLDVTDPEALLKAALEGDHANDDDFDVDGFADDDEADE